jgi:hypothetical protein
MKRLCIALLALLLVACGGSYSEEVKQEYIDKCIIKAGPQPEDDNVLNYCLAKWRQSQREK